MKRWIGTVVVLLVLAGLILVPALVNFSSVGDDSDTAVITRYDADFDIDDTGTMQVRERLTVRLPPGKHGIFRFFDRNDPTDPRVRLDPHYLEVTRDGQPEHYVRLKEGRGRYLNLKIGSAGATLSGDHVYEIRYRMTGVLAKGTDGSPTQFYWNLIPGGWAMMIEQTRLTVRLPAAAQEVRCAVGNKATSGCTVTGEGSQTLTISTGRLDRRTPVTLKTGLDMAPPSRGELHPWSLTASRLLGPSVPGLLVVLLLSLGSAAAGLLLARPTRERDPQFPLMYAPPPGIGPAQARYLLTERIGKEAFVASILESSEKGATRLHRSDGWLISDANDQAAWQRVDPATAHLNQLLGSRGGRFTADSSIAAGKLLQVSMKTWDATIKKWARDAGLMTTAGLGLFGGVLVIGSLLLAGFLAVMNPFNFALVALVPGLFGAFGLAALFPGASTRRTAAGRELWSRLGGFKRVLATPSSEARFDFSGRKELYTAYIPWAVAFGCAAEWAQKYRLEMHEEPPEPSYAAGWVGYQVGAGGFADSVARDFNTAVTSAISAYSASQSSSSSGGGGFSGGGGGGGGGGGSW